MSLRISSDILKNAKNKVYKQNLKDQTVLIDKFISSNLHDPYFTIKQLPEVFGSGKNLIYIDSNNSNLQKNTDVNVEILDSNNDPIYYEILDVLNKDYSRVISVVIDSNTPQGNGMLYITGTAIRYSNGVIIDPNISEIDRKVRYKIPIYINPSIRTTSPILFSTKPKISITETIVGATSTDLVSDTNTIQQLGSVTYEYRNGKAYLIANGWDIEREMLGSEIRIDLNNPTPATSSLNAEFNVTGSTSFTSSLMSIIDSSTALLSEPIKLTDRITNRSIIFTKTEASSYTLLYTGSKTTENVHNSQSYAIIEMSDITPTTGDIFKLRTFQKQKATQHGDYQIMSETDVKASPLFFNPNNNDLDNDLGFIESKTHIDNSYTLVTFNTTPTSPNTIETGSNLNNSLKLNYSASFSDGEYLGIRVQSQFNITRLSSGTYECSLDLIGMTDINNPGNPALRVELKSADDINFTRKILDITQDEDYKKYGVVKTTFDLGKPLTNVYYIIWMERGTWEVSNIKFNAKQTFGFTPSYTRHIIPVNIRQRNDLVDFKFEFVTQNGDTSPLAIEIPKLAFTGSNTYLSGDDNVMDGQLSISKVPGEGIILERPCKVQTAGLFKSPQFTSFDQMITDHTGSINTTGGIMMLAASGSDLSACRDNLTGSSYSNNTSFDMITDEGAYLKYRAHGLNQELSLIETHKPQLIHNDSSIQAMNSDTPLEIASFMMIKTKLIDYITVVGRWFISTGGASGETGTFNIQADIVPTGSINYINVPLTDYLQFGDGVFTGPDKQVLTAATFSLAPIPNDSLVKFTYSIVKDVPGGTQNANSDSLVFYGCHKSQINRLQNIYPVKPNI